MTFFRKLSFKPIQKVLVGGVLILTASILLSVLAVLSLVEALICSLLTIPTRNRKLNKAAQTFLNRLGNGSSQAPSKD
jgi:hypothetical protein